MSTQSILILSGVVCVFLTFGVALAWADLSTADIRRADRTMGTREGD